MDEPPIQMKSHLSDTEARMCGWEWEKAMEEGAGNASSPWQRAALGKFGMACLCLWLCFGGKQFLESTLLVKAIPVIVYRISAAETTFQIIN